MCCAAADVQHRLKEFSVESRSEALCALGKLEGQAFQIVKQSQELIL